MTSENPDVERELPSLPPRRVVGPVFASVVLHGALLYLVARVAIAPPDTVEREERPSVRVSVDLRSPAPVPPEPAVPKVPELAPAVVTPAEPQLVEAPAIDSTEQVAVEEEVSAGGESIAPATTDRAWTPARIRAAIESNASEQRSAATTAWLSDCLLEQKERGTRDCEEQRREQDYASASSRAGQNAGAGAFAGVRRPDRDRRLADQWTRSNYALEKLVEEGGLTGMMATDRIRLNNEYLRYIQGNVLGFQGQDPLWQAMGSGSMNGGFTADVLGGPRLSLPGKVPFRCGSGRLRPGLTPGGVGVSDIVPCIFEFNGFTITVPDAPVDPNAFRVIPSVPGRPQPDTPANPITP